MVRFIACWLVLDGRGTIIKMVFKIKLKLKIVSIIFIW